MQQQHITTVHDACEGLWVAPDAAAALDCLQAVHTAILRDGIETYDASETFLAIQGCALRFRRQEDRLSAIIKHEALLSTAALARLHVGPAWWYQLEKNRRRIPEVLPAAIIRFASTLSETATCLALPEAALLDWVQAQVVIVLSLCLPPVNGNGESQWVIPGIQDVIGNMVHLWLTVVAQVIQDWPSRLPILRACREIIVADYSPLAAHSEFLVTRLLEVVTAAGSSRPLHGRAADRLAAVSCEKDALFSLSYLAKRGLIPLHTVPEMVNRLLALHTSENSQPPPSEEEEATRELDLAGPIIELLSNQVSSDLTAEKCIGLIRNVTKDAAGGGVSEELDRMRTAAASAYNVMGIAFWGSRELGLQGKVHLRLYWDLMLDSIACCLDSLQDTGSQGREERQQSIAMQESDALLAVAAVEALRRAVESQVEDNTSLFTQAEWMKVIETTSSKNCWILGCLSIDDAAKRFVSAFQRVLEHFLQTRSSCFVPSEAQKKLYVFLLRYAAANDDAEAFDSLGTVVLRCWDKFCLQRVGLTEWCTEYTTLVTEVFREDVQQGWCLQPDVRLEALQLLWAGDDRKAFTAGESSGFISKLLQLQPESFSILVEACILPTLKRTLVLAGCRSGKSSSIDLPCTATPACGSNVGTVDVVENLSETAAHTLAPAKREALPLFAVSLIGHLSRRKTSLQKQLIALLEFAAVATRQENCDPDAAIIPNAIIVSAIFELERSLCLLHDAPQQRLFCHAICSVLDSYTRLVKDLTVDHAEFSSVVVIAAAALRPLTRLHVASDSDIGKSIREMDGSIPSLLSWIFHDCCQGEENAITVASTTSRHFTDGGFDFEDAETSILAFLQVSTSIVRGVGMSAATRTTEAYAALKCMRAHCMDSLRKWALAAIPVRLPFDAVKTIFSNQHHCGEHGDERIAIKTLVQCTANYVTWSRLKSIKSASRLVLDSTSLLLQLDTIVRFTESQTAAVRRVATNGFTALLPGLCSLQRVHGSVANIFGFLGEDFAMGRRLSLVTIAHDLLRTQPTPLVESLLLLHLFLQVLPDPEDEKTLFDRFCMELGLRCLPGLLDRMNHIELVNAQNILGNTNTESDAFVAMVTQLLSRNPQDSRAIESEDDRNGNESRHYRFADEAERIERFEDEGDSSGGCAAWLVGGNILLTCRLGSRRSRYAGYIEVVVRSPSERHRSVVKVSADIAKAERDAGAEKDNETTGEEAASWEALLEKSNERNAMGRAAAVLARFEEAISEQDRTVKSATRAVTSQLQHSRGLDQWLRERVDDDETHRQVSSTINRFLAQNGIPVNLGGSQQARCLVADDRLHRAICVLDRTPLMDTYKVALLFEKLAAPTANTESRLLGATSCSPAFYRFAKSLGDLVPTKSLKYFTGGLDNTKYQSDGEFALVWTDGSKGISTAATACIVFHAVNFMPRDSATNPVGRKRHVGNDNVTILFSDRGSRAQAEFEGDGGVLIGGEFGFVAIFVSLVAPECMRICVRPRKGLEGSRPAEAVALLSQFDFDTVLAAVDAPSFIRNVAMRADLACRVICDAPNAAPSYRLRTESIRSMERFVARKAG